MKHTESSEMWQALVQLVILGDYLILLVCGAFCDGLTHWGRDKINAILQTTFSNAYSWMKMYEFWLKFQWSLFLKV